MLQNIPVLGYDINYFMYIFIVVEFADSASVRLKVIHLTSDIHQLLSHCALWTASYEGLRSDLVTELTEKINTASKQLANHLVLFMQVSKMC